MVRSNFTTSHFYSSLKRPLQRRCRAAQLQTVRAETVENFGAGPASILAGKYGHASLQYYSLIKDQVEYVLARFAPAARMVRS